MSSVNREVAEEDIKELPPGYIRTVVLRNGLPQEEVVSASELARLQAQRQAALRELQRAEDMVTVPDWVQLHPLVGAYLAEALGSFLWVLTVSLSKADYQDSSLVLEATAQMHMLPTGLILAAVIFALGYVSGGHFNPAVSFAAFLAREMTFSRCFGYMVVQLSAALGAGLIAMMILDDDDIFVPTVSDEYITSGVFSELIFTLAIALVALNTRYSRQSGNFFYGLGMGMTVSAGAACAGRISGGSFNPAAATGLQAALCFSGDCAALQVFWVYWVAPLIGAAFAVLFYTQMEQPLNSAIRLQDDWVVPAQVEVEEPEAEPTTPIITVVTDDREQSTRE